ncbi:MAG: DNA adenine methylase [Victivallaceae bacterium]|nr:DNA adenine methylase [Victivallaceae bacterium]
MSKTKLKPFLKWAGGKSQLLEEIQKHYPCGLGTVIKKYAEPFIGGGAVFFDILNNYELEALYISDTNAELINVYSQIKDNVGKLLQMLNTFQGEYLPLDTESRKEYYYAKRERFNTLKREHSLTVETAALFIFLNKTCFNGLYRVNSKGDFNVPMGAYKKPIICDIENLINVSKALGKVTIVCADYKQSATFADETTFAYFDPPYRPLNVTSSFNSYTENDFDDEAQTELAVYIQSLVDRGVYVVASNSDPKNTNPDDDFFDNLYKNLTINRITANRMINSNANSRGKIGELLIFGNIKDKENEKKFCTMVG